METTQTIPPTDTTFAESETITPIEEYGLKWGISRRTTDRYVKNGRVRVIKKAGRTFCIDTEPKPAMAKPDMPGFSDRQSDTSFDLPARNDWIQFGIMTGQAKQANVFKTLSVGLSFVLVAVVSVATYWFILQDRRGIADGYEIRNLESSLVRTKAALVTAEKIGADEKARLLATVGGLELKITELTKINIELATVGGLELKIKELIKTNIELTTIIKNAPQR